MFSQYTRAIAVALFLMFSSLTAFAQQDLQAVIDRFCRKECISAQELVDVVDRVSKAYILDPVAVLTIIHIESKYHIKAKNGSSVGLTQVLLRYHRPKFLGKNYFDVQDNIFAGMQVLRDCVRKTKGDIFAASGCYNGGGDKKYSQKFRKQYAIMQAVVKPRPTEDHLGAFIERLV